jgi:hypothetical protein
MDALAEGGLELDVDFPPPLPLPPPLLPPLLPLPPDELP